MSQRLAASGLLLAWLFILPAYAQFSVSDLSQLRDYESRRTSSFDRSGGNGDYKNLKAGGELVLFDEVGPAEIRHIWITMDSPEAYHLKKIVLRIYWDGEKTPSVETPIGDFFGLGLGTYTVFNSAPLVVAPDKALNAYFPMPFARSGRITVANEGSKDATDFYWNIDWVKLPRCPSTPPISTPSIASALHARDGSRAIFTAMTSARRAKTRAGRMSRAIKTTPFSTPMATASLWG